VGTDAARHEQDGASSRSDPYELGRLAECDPIAGPGGLIRDQGSTWVQRSLYEMLSKKAVPSTALQSPSRTIQA
jgi:hypothetical protein